MNKLNKSRNAKQRQSMPENNYLQYPEILVLTPGLGIKLQPERGIFSMNKLMKFRDKSSHQMPEKIINKISDILAPGSGVKLESEQVKFTMNELIKLTNDKECKHMNENIIVSLPETLSPGLGIQFSLNKSMRFKNDKTCQ